VVIESFTDFKSILKVSLIFMTPNNQFSSSVLMDWLKQLGKA